jgi:hypothetical protein
LDGTNRPSLWLGRALQGQSLSVLGGIASICNAALGAKTRFHVSIFLGWCTRSLSDFPRKSLIHNKFHIMEINQNLSELMDCTTFFD